MRLFNDRPDGPGKYKSWVTHLFVYLYLFSLNENCSATPISMTTMLLIWGTKSMVRGTDQLCFTSFPIAFSKAVASRLVLADLWFPRKVIADRSDLLVSSFIGEMWYWEPFRFM